MSYYAALSTPTCSFSVIENVTEIESEISVINVPKSEISVVNGLELSKVVATDKYYIIRPYVELNGLSNGYMWSQNNLGSWRSLMKTNKKIYTSANTGNYSLIAHRKE